MTIHDAMAELLRSGEASSVFERRIVFASEAERLSFEEMGDPLEWLQQASRIEERDALLATLVFPAILSDMLLCLYEALECSRKGKLAVAYMLIRKPLQEGLYVLEALVDDRKAFAERLSQNPILLDGKGVGGPEVHARRITSLLAKIGLQQMFDPSLVAQLRYDKKAADSFDGICNVAMHLFTSHPAIRTEALNINFIFSGEAARISQWSYLYSRLPYLLEYMRKLTEHISESIVPTHPSYLSYLERRLGALQQLAWSTVAEPYQEPRLQAFVAEVAKSLDERCVADGYRPVSAADLPRMAETGAYPGESRLHVALRGWRFRFLAFASRAGRR